MAVLKGVADSIPEIAKAPSPIVQITGMNAVGFTYDLRVVMSRFEDFPVARSNLYRLVNETFAREGIQIVG